MPLDKRERQDRVTRQNTERAILAIISTYYPSPLREKILSCCLAQRAGNYRRTCRHALCPACCPKECHKIAQTQYARFAACTPPHKPGPRLAHEVYTLPPYLRPRILSRAGYNAWAEATRATIREIHGADVAGVMNLHPIGERDLTTFHPHWDVVINGYLLGETGRVREHRPAYIHFDDARAIYTRHLVRAFGLAGDDVPRRVDLHLDRSDGRTFHSRPRKTRHMVRYSSRHIYQPQWARLQEHGTGGDWWYKPEKDRESVRAYEGRDVIDNLLFVQALLRGRKRRIWFGYMQNRLYRKSAAAFADQAVPEARE